MGNAADSLAVCLFEASAQLHILLSRFFDIMSSMCYYLGSKILGAKPCVNSSPNQRALLLVGAADGIGRAMALKFAQQGYTVFACVPNYDTQIHEAEEAWTSTVSSLVYSWQKDSRMQGRSGHGRNPKSRGGSIIPLSFDYSRLEDRRRALETVIAYCARHSLQFSSLVLSPRQAFHSSDTVLLGKAHPETEGSTATEKQEFAPALLSHIDGTAWSELIRREVTEPVLVIQDFVGSLTSSKGRVVILSGCSEAWAGVMQGPTTPCDVAREAIARQFRRELAPQGISVSHVIAAPLAKGRTRWRKSSALSRSNEVSANLRRDLRLSMIYAIDSDTVFSVVSRAVDSSYPKPTYYAGISVHLHRWAQFIPDFILLAWDNMRRQ